VSFPVKDPGEPIEGGDPERPGLRHLNRNTAIPDGSGGQALNQYLQDYVLRSVGAIFVPLGAILLCGILIIEAHIHVIGWIEQGRRRGPLRAVILSTTFGGLALFGIGMASEMGRPVVAQEQLVTPLAFALGLAGMSYGGHLRKKRTALLLADSRPNPTLSRLASLKLVLAGVLIVLSLFWALGDWAEAAGRGAAEQLVQDIPYRPGVVIFSKEQLFPDGSGVRAEGVGNAQSTYHFRYSDLKLLIRADHKFFLVTSNWSDLNPLTIVLPESDSRLVEFVGQ